MAKTRLKKKYLLLSYKHWAKKKKIISKKILLKRKIVNTNVYVMPLKKKRPRIKNIKYLVFYKKLHLSLQCY